jgi:hypothetical protein
VTHYEFLKALHDLLQPRNYLEIGVQNGHSLELATCPAFGVDPSPQRAARMGETIFSMTSDEFFAQDVRGELSLPVIDLVYIDGMHLFEFALRDFIGAARLSNPTTVIVFDDVLPYNAAIAAREQPVGDWTGDVWKVIPIIEEYVDCVDWLVDVSPTGALVVTRWDPEDIRYLADNYEHIMERYMNREVPPWVLERNAVDAPAEVLAGLKGLWGR